MRQLVKVGNIFILGLANVNNTQGSTACWPMGTLFNSQQKNCPGCSFPIFAWWLIFHIKYNRISRITWYV